VIFDLRLAGRLLGLGLYHISELLSQVKKLNLIFIFI